MSETEETNQQPNPVIKSDQEIERPVSQSGTSKPGNKKLPIWMVVLVILLLILAGILAGYGSGMGQRYDAKNTQVAGQLQEQLDLGIQKMEAGQYEVAKSHFIFIIENDPNFPGVMEAYSELLLLMQITPSPTPTLTPSFTPTPDLRGVEAIYANVRVALTDRDWDTLLTNLDSLRKTDPNYRTAEVDGLYYLAFRMRGVGKIILQEGETCSDINLEGGIYDLTLAERFGQLDAVAESLRSSSRFYIIGASYWDQDWTQAQAIFDQVRVSNAYLRDASCMTSTERWRYATLKRAEELQITGDSCAAEEQYNLAFTIETDRNMDYFPTATEISNLCDGGGGAGDNEEPAAEGTLTETPTGTPAGTPTP